MHAKKAKGWLVWKKNSIENGLVTVFYDQKCNKHSTHKLENECDRQEHAYSMDIKVKATFL